MGFFFQCVRFFPRARGFAVGRALVMAALLPFFVAALLTALPDPTAILMEEASLPVADAEALAHRLFLDLSWAGRSRDLLQRLCSGTWGLSPQNGQPIEALFWQAFGTSGLLIAAAWAISLAGGIVLGLGASALYPRAGFGFLQRFAAILSALPTVGIGILCSRLLLWAPAGWDSALGFFLAALSLGFSWIGVCALSCCHHLTALLRIPQAAGLKAYGLGRRRFFTFHGIAFLRRPLQELSFVYVVHLLGNTLIVEHIFNRYGIGRLLLESLAYQDYETLGMSLVGLGLFCIATGVAADLYKGRRLDDHGF